MSIDTDLRKMEEKLSYLRSLTHEDLILYKINASTDYETYKSLSRLLRTLPFVSFAVMLIFIFSSSISNVTNFILISSTVVAVFTTVLYYFSRKCLKGLHTLRLIEFLDSERETKGV